MTLHASMIPRSIDKAVDRLLESRHCEAQKEKERAAAVAMVNKSLSFASFKEETVVYFMEATGTSKSDSLKMLLDASVNSEGDENETLKNALTQFLRD